jgi:hypothetical protein
MLPDPKVKCPATGFAKSCHQIVTKCTCPKFVAVKFRNPQSGEMVDKYGCVDSFLHLLLIENSQMSRQTGAAVESFRNETVKASEAAAQERRAALVQFAALGGPKLVGNSG